MFDTPLPRHAVATKAVVFDLGGGRRRTGAASDRREIVAAPREDAPAQPVRQVAAKSAKTQATPSATIAVAISAQTL